MARLLVLIVWCVAAAWAGPALAAPVRLTVHGAGLHADETLTVRLTNESGEAVEAALNDRGTQADQTAGDALWTGEAELRGDRFTVAFVAGTRDYPEAAVVWGPGAGHRWVNFMLRGGEVDVAAGVNHADDEDGEAPVAAGRPWGFGTFLLVVAMVLTIGVAERWGRGRPPVGLKRLPAPPPLGGVRLPRGPVRVADEAIAGPLVAALVRTHTVIFVGDGPAPVAPGRVRRLKHPEPERLAGAVAACRDTAVAVVVVGAGEDAQEWAEAAATLPADVPVFVLVGAGEAGPELVEAAGEVGWAS